MTATAYRARYVFPAVGDPIPDGVVTVEDGRITAVGRQAGRDKAIQDLGNAAILPGLVNAHTHLNFSNIAKPFGHRGISFVDWLRLVMASRRNPQPDPETVVAQGLRESFDCGVRTVADIVQADWPQAVAAASGVRVVAFRELIAPTVDRIPAAIAAAEKHLKLAEVSVGLSPHAPYTVQPALLATAVHLSQRHRKPLAMHLAESAEELEWMQWRKVAMQNFLETENAWQPTLLPSPQRPLDYLRTLAGAWRALVIHGNYLNEEEIDFVAKHADRMTIVYCPRSHDWFQHRPYPLAEMLAAGAPVALGTDGRGSAPDLNLFEEMRWVAQRHPSVRRETILQMGTLFGAKALGLDHEIGSLKPGKQADFAIVKLPEREASDPYELLLGARD